MFDTLSLYAFDRAAQRTAALVGVDEAGRGPLAGPVVAAAVRLQLDAPIEGLNDSKKLSATQRARVYERIVNEAVCWGVGIASVEEIEQHNILQATLLAMQRALDTLNCEWDVALIDGNQPLATLVAARQQTVVAGDARSASIAAASVVAKVTRDRLMEQAERLYPCYGFARHKGYGTREHITCIKALGLSPLHRPSFCRRLPIPAATALP